MSILDDTATPGPLTIPTPGIPVGPHMPALDGLLAQSPLPALPGAEGIAERLVLLIHRGVDWEVWGGPRRIRYWDALTDRVRAATYSGPTLSHWWQEISTQITSAPRTAADRSNLAVLIAAPAQREVLTALAEHAATLVLRVRVLSETRAAARPESQVAGEGERV